MFEEDVAHTSDDGLLDNADDVDDDATAAACTAEVDSRRRAVISQGVSRRRIQFSRNGFSNTVTGRSGPGGEF